MSGKARGVREGQGRPGRVRKSRRAREGHGVSGKARGCQSGSGRVRDARAPGSEPQLHPRPPKFTSSQPCSCCPLSKNLRSREGREFPRSLSNCALGVGRAGKVAPWEAGLELGQVLKGGWPLKNKGVGSESQRGWPQAGRAAGALALFSKNTDGPGRGSE